MLLARRVALVLSLLPGVWLVSKSAFAQPTPADRALATDLFQRGRKALLAGDYAAACPLLAESQHLDPAGGTLLNLALCHEQIGRTASAWSEFHDALSLARRERRDDRIQYARQHIAALETRLSHLRIELAPSAAVLPGLRVERDGSELGHSSFSVAMPVDPGEHTLRVSAPGYQARELRVMVGDPADTQQVVIEPLEPEAKPALAISEPTPAPAAILIAEPGPTPPALGPRPLSRLRKSALASFAISIVSAALATGFGVRAIKLRSSAESACSAGRCSPRAFDLNDRARRFADAATGLSAVAGVGITTGLFLWWRVEVP